MVGRMKKEEDSGELGIYTNIDKTAVVQDIRVFSESPLNTRKCSQLLTKTLYLLYQGEPFTADEATKIFFAASKAFQSKDTQLRRLLFLVIKELSHKARDVIIVTSSLTQDVNSRNEAAFRASALRALGTICDPSMIAGIERVLKQAFVDRSSIVASSALVASAHMFSRNRDTVKRWVSEIQQCLGTRGMTQYHALGLMQLIRQNDRIALSKLVQSMSTGAQDMHAICLFLRSYAQLAFQESGSSTFTPIDLKPFLRFRGRSEMVVLEAARVVCDLPDIYAGDILFAVTALQNFLSSNKPLIRFSALRTLNKLALRQPQKVATCNQDIEGLVRDSNRSVATLAITTLLKTGSEASADRLVRQATENVSDITDDFKIIVVDAVRTLGIRFPARHVAMLDFLGRALLDHGGYEYKRSAVDALIELGARIPEARQMALAHLCDFIEDCEHPRLSIRVLHLFGREGPSMPNPSKYIRHIYNRLILENERVRAAAVSALIRFAVRLDSLRPKIIALLKPYLEDADDEVRDRTAIYLRSLENETKTRRYFDDDSTCELEILENKLLCYSEDIRNFAKPFDISNVPIITRDELFASSKKGDGRVPSRPFSPSNGNLEPAIDETIKRPLGTDASRLAAFANYGPIFKSSRPFDLTEPEMEYVVASIKHVYAEHIVIEFIVRNTLHEQFLQNVTVAVQCDSAFLQPISATGIDRLVYDDPQSCFVVFHVKSIGDCPEATFSSQLRFTAIDCNPDTYEPLGPGISDEFTIEGFEIGVSDYIKGVEVSEFDREWASLGNTNELTDTFALTALSSVKTAVRAIVDLLGAKAIEGSEVVDPQSPSHILLLAGMMIDGDRFLARARLADAGSAGVTMEMSFRATSLKCSELIASAIN